MSLPLSRVLYDSDLETPTADLKIRTAEVAIYGIYAFEIIKSVIK